jgi:hypothetical protein
MDCGGDAASRMDVHRTKAPPTSSSSAEGHRLTSSFQTTMASRRRGPPSYHTTAPEKEKLLIEEGFVNFTSLTAPPPRWHGGRLHQRATGVAAEHRRA